MVCLFSDLDQAIETGFARNHKSKGRRKKCLKTQLKNLDGRDILALIQGIFFKKASNQVYAIEINVLLTVNFLMILGPFLV
jgi:hypothetical protein